MTVYLFKRHKKTGKKTIIDNDITKENAIIECNRMNCNQSAYWFEFSRFREYAEN